MSRTVFEFSAGGVVVDGERVLLVRTTTLRGKRVWTFPKGLIEAGEARQQAARREVEEETGYRCEVVAELPASRYWFQRRGERVRKTVYWFLMRPVQKVGEHDAEIEAVAWVPLAEAARRLSYTADRRLLRLVQQRLAGGAAGP
ncbi:MAG: hypothetical protein KatS3mg131_3550 [Candidatus Tectimicrobiota bacterium]|nr:MAG: hypothetical protein KatS3mg131_3550 [Candidatus Tectomicrobia bacterium]